MHNTAYVAKTPNADGLIPYTSAENAVWHDLITRQLPIVEMRGCKEYLKGLEILDFSHEHIPQLNEVSNRLKKTTGWEVTQVPAIITPDHFFQLLSKRQFPAATFIRHRDELDYLQEPDIFHEFFGHCPMLTDQNYADFMQQYGELSITATKEEQTMLARIYWFTVEFGLVNTKDGTRVYGGGILSSMSETPYSLESPVPKRLPFDLKTVLRTPYRIDIKQPIYFVIPNFKTLYDLLELLRRDLKTLHAEIVRLGMHPPEFPVGDGVEIF